MVLAQKKKADHRAANKLAGEALAKKSKDLRLVGWLVESQLRMENFSVLAPGIDLLRALQENFWPTFYPPIEEGGDLELRMLTVETVTGLISAATRKVPLTKSGLSFEDYLAAHVVGYEKDATTDARQEARKDAIDHGRLTAEDFDHAFAATPKSFYVDANAALAESLEATERLDEFQQQIYGSSAPNISKLRDGLTEIHQIAELLLNERRKTEPDPVPAAEKPEPGAAGEAEEPGQTEEGAEGETSGEPTRRRAVASGQLGRTADAYALIVESAEFLFQKDPSSPVPYLVCAGMRFGETRMQGPTPAPGFAVGPTPQIRQSLRTLANKEAWGELMRASLPILASECARAWLDLHRYIWRAAQETGATAISAAVAGTVRSLLVVRPELRQWTLEDDTGAANPETQQWLDSTVLQ
jgi:type VI secretion system protein ImpA